ncbi:hypothetical protein K491DRAFT_611964 [Lophiostoma macrostomum CBS 122681]|uniref:Uncharacterized protein n=1 Tax=Lophiostoma macrostomum CBS 122681 TaxID=1314788 RepID=A0A6A6SLQ7_9PLEO|nr:hypothetical protein K491DRAFT_611964 [Lophiostoma macrostomum CBS 122681]
MVNNDHRIVSLNNVRAILKPLTSPHAALFLDLINSWKNFPLKQNAAAQGKKRFGAHFPRLVTNKRRLEQLSSTEKLRDILLDELVDTEKHAEEGLVPFPSDDDLEADDESAVDLVTNITNPSFVSEGCIPDLPSTTLADLGGFEEEVVHEVLFELPTTCSVFPCGHLIDLQHQNESVGFFTLATGSIAWIVWPPDVENLNTMTKAYEDYMEVLDTGEFADVARDLSGGVAFVQQAGETLHLPPFCPIIGLVMETAVLVRYAAVTESSFISMCRNIPLYKAWWNTEICAEEKQACFAKALCDCITHILQGEFDDINMEALKHPITPKGFLPTFLHVWDDIKEDVVSVMDANSAEELKHVWNEFLNSSTTQTCLICGVRCRPDRNHNRSQHFENKHWTQVTQAD